jgi:hypothetical protein
MSIINSSEYDEQISYESEPYPHNGTPKKKWGCGSIVVGIIGAIVFLAILGKFTPESDYSNGHDYVETVDTTPPAGIEFEWDTFLTSKYPGCYHETGKPNASKKGGLGIVNAKYFAITLNGNTTKGIICSYFDTTTGKINKTWVE